MLLLWTKHWKNKILPEFYLLVKITQYYNLSFSGFTELHPRYSNISSGRIFNSHIFKLFAPIPSKFFLMICLYLYNSPNPQSTFKVSSRSCYSWQVLHSDNETEWSASTSLGAGKLEVELELSFETNLKEHILSCKPC